MQLLFRPNSVVEMLRWRPYRQCFAIAFLLVFVAIPAFAQVNTGAIVGTVLDPSGAVVPGATIEVKDVATGVVTQLRTNKSGEYQALQLIPGTYEVKAMHPGYSSAVQQGVAVRVAGRVAVNFKLKIGTVHEAVTVNSTAATLQTQSAQQSATFGTRSINSLPLPGRDYDKLALLAPGAFHMPNAEVANPAEGLFTANGNLPLQNDYLLDGISNNSGSENLQEQSAQAIIPPPDALQEFKIQTRTYSAQFGTSAGAVVNVSTKSGTNRFHGDLYEYAQNAALNANTWFNDYGGVSKGPFSQNEFGGTLGGPITRNHTFFFVAYQNLLSSTTDTVLSTVPTPEMKKGNFQSVESTHPMTALANGQSGCINNNIIAPSCIDPVGQAILNLYPNPSPQLGDINVFTGAPNYEFVTSVPNNTKTLDTRFDQSLNAKNKIFERYALDWSDYQSPKWTSNPIVGNGEFSTQYILHDQSIALGWTYLPSSTTLNTLHFGFLRENSKSNPVGLTLGVSDAPKYGLTGVPVNPETAGLPPTYIFGLTTIGSSIYRPQFQAAQTYQVNDNFYKLMGRHSVQLGYQYEEDSLNFFDIEAPQGAMMAEGIYSDTPGFGVADYLMGDIGLAIYETPLNVNNVMRGNSLYAQDTWRATPKLTLDYGLRYELYPPFWISRENRTSNFSPANGGQIITATSNDGWYGRTLIHPNYDNFVPRIGFAYHIFKPVVLRGGFGIFHQFINRIGSEAMLQLNPPFLHDVLVAKSFGSKTPVFQLKNGFPSASLSKQGVDLPALQIRAQDPNNRTTYVEQASFGPQFQLNSNTILNITYVGNWGRKINRLRNENQGRVIGFNGSSPIVKFPYPNLNTEVEALNGAGQHAFLEYGTNDGNSDFNALELELSRSFSHGLMYRVSYTWSHNMADFVQNLTSGIPAILAQNAYDYSHAMSNAAQDVRQRFVASGIWALPVGKGGLLLNNDGTAAKLIGGWQVNAIVQMQTGIPFSVTASNESDTGGTNAEYADCVGNPFSGTSTNPKDYAGSKSSGRFINPAAFSQPGPGEFGSCRPRAFHGPGIKYADLSLFKQFPLGGSRRLQFRTEFFDAFNHPNFTNPSASVNNPGAFGKSFGTSTSPRIIQFAGKFFF